MTTTTNSWFRVDRDGLRKLIEHRGKALVLFELIQNAWDTDAGNVQVILVKEPGRPAATLTIRDDDPNGFADLTHAYTLFAESAKKSDATKRGRFNLGEKLVLALCKSARVISTTGEVIFGEDGTMRRTKERTAAGSVFTAEIRMNADEFTEFHEAFHRLISPGGVTTTLNGVELAHRAPVTAFSCTLATLVSNSEGELRPTKRNTTVEIHEPKPGETAWLYEMGIPIVETGDRYHVNVGQKIPLNMDRDNVTPAYLTAIRAAVLNHCAERLTPAQAAESWVTDALGSADVEVDAVETAITKRFGLKRAIYDASDREANNKLVADGYTLVHGASLPAAVWANVREHSVMLPSGRIAPTPKPYSDDPNAPQVQMVPMSEWTDGMREVYDITRWCAAQLGVHDDLLVEFAKPTQRTWAACYGQGSGLHYNMTRLGRKWFDTWTDHVEGVLDLIIHELAHSRASNHLDSAYHDACTEFGAKLAMAFFRNPKKIPHFKKLREAA